MKKTVLSATLCSATLFLAATRADMPKTSAAAASTVMDPAAAELVRRYDTNHDGKLDEDELAAAHEGMLRQNFTGPTTERGKKVRAALIKRFDRNGDGQLDDSEKAAMRQYFLERFDTNHDGRLDEEERAAMREQLKADAKAGKFKN
jgi:Ca2+-binding EF-hand superfamily protein